MQTLEPLLVQDASLEICKVATIIETNSISGTNVIPFQMPGSEGFDVNYPADFEYLKYLISSKSVTLPQIILS
jgi:CMP-N-acetylneuraminic acid synthetase